jgi:hypothetical protein
MVFFYIAAIALGIFSGLLTVGYAMHTIPCPFDRVAFYFTLLSSLFMAVLLSYLLLGSLAFSVLATFSLTKLFLWCIMDPSKMVHFQGKLEN